MNSVKLYSNGTALICREYRFQDQQRLEISIPVRRSDLDDVVSSLTIFGNVSVVSPPTYTPTNVHETELTFDPKRVLKDVATKLSGASVEIDAGIRYVGVLVGMQQYQRKTNGTTVDTHRLVVLTQKGLQQIEEEAITAIRLTDAVVQAEVDKALKASLGRIKPDSSLIELSIEPNNSETTAFVAYATPVAAWKIRYHLRLTSGSVELEGQAIVDNDTDDDWNDSAITVITGDPITFSSDLAEIRRPARNRINVVSSRAISAVVAESVFNTDILLDEREVTMAIPGAGGYAAAPVPMRMAKRAIEREKLPERAEQLQAEVKESGDFSQFTSPEPVTIKAKRSAIIPLFQVGIAEAPRILFYREVDDSLRPFRAIRLVNSTAFSLGRGICVVFKDVDFQGKCILEPTRSGEEALLIYARETGVRVTKDEGRAESRRVSIRITDGTAYCEDRNRRQMVYRITNSHSETFLLEIEHPREWKSSKQEVTVSSGEFKTVKIPNGQRIRVTLDSKGSQQVTVKEEQIVNQKYTLDVPWLQRHVIEIKQPHSPPEGIQECIQLQKRIDNIMAELNEKVLATKTLDEEQKRLLKLIPSSHSEQANEWRTDLANAEKELRHIQRTLIPKLNADLVETRRKLEDAIVQLQYAWAE